jgi:large subunit ribosomal protein L19
MKKQAKKSTPKSKAAPKKTAPVSRRELTVLDKLKQVSFKTDMPHFKAGDKIVVRQKIKEGDKFRIQAFEGIVIARNGSGIAETFTVRKVSGGVGVERVFPFHSPMIAGVDIKVEGFVRRGKLYYLRELEGKASRIQDKNLKLAAAHGAQLSSQVTSQVSAKASSLSAADGEAQD